MKKTAIRKLRILHNPFVEKDKDFKIPVNEIVSKTYYKKIGDIWLPQRKLVDSEEHVKYYKRHKKDFINLPLNSKGLLWWIIGETESGRDHVVINMKRCLADNKISLSTYKRAVKGLEKAEILRNARFYSEEFFWLNPKYFFNGSRLKKYKKKTDER